MLSRISVYFNNINPVQSMGIPVMGLFLEPSIQPYRSSLAPACNYPLKALRARRLEISKILSKSETSFTYLFLIPTYMVDNDFSFTCSVVIGMKSLITIQETTSLHPGVVSEPW